MSTNPPAHLLRLLQQVVQVAQALAEPKATPGADRSARSNRSAHGRGIYPHQSKYNPWRAYVWDTEQLRSVYLGAFPTRAAARAAQKAAREGTPILKGTTGPRRVA